VASLPDRTLRLSDAIREGLAARPDPAPGYAGGPPPRQDGASVSYIACMARD